MNINYARIQNDNHSEIKFKGGGQFITLSKSGGILAYI